jgi:transposase
MQITTLGIDVAKNVFQLHGADARGRAVFSRRVKRNQLLHAVASLPPCVIGMEACGSAQHWGRAFEQLGHTVKLMHPKYVRPYVKTNKNDRRDAEAICEAVSRPTMRGVSIKTVEQADLQAVHRTRSLFVKHRTAVINQIRGLLAEYGLVIAQSPEKVRPALVRFLDDAASGLTACARETFSELYEQLTELDSRIKRVTHRVERVYRAHPVCQKLAAVPGIGPMTATALVATVGRPQAFRNGRHLAAWLGKDDAIDGTTVEVATIGREGMVGLSVFLGDQTPVYCAVIQWWASSLFHLLQGVRARFRETAVDLGPI